MKNLFGKAAFAAVMLSSFASGAQAEVKDAVVGFLMPDQASTRYEERD